MKKMILFLLAFGPAQAIFCQKNIPQKLDELMTAYCKVNKFNGAVLVARKGNVLLEKGYGFKNAQLGTRNDANSIFQIYSITKTFTSTLVLKLAALKRLSVSDKLSKFYPGFPNGDSITIEHLLTHTSGIYDGDGVPSQTETTLVAFLKTKPLDFSPGTQWRYSNSGYRLLGYIIEKVSGMTYGNALKKYIFDPLKMIHSGINFKDLADKNKTTGYEIFTSTQKKEAIIYAAPGPFAAGAIYSTVGDMYKYERGLTSFRIIDSSSLNKAYTSFKNNYGYGWMIHEYEGRKIVSHSGGAAGYRSNFARILKDDICIILLNNTENTNVELITKTLTAILLDKPYQLPFEINVQKEILVKYTGTFQVADPPLTMYITLDDGRLTAQATRQQRTTGLAQKEDLFFMEEANGFLEFPKDSLGKYDQLIIRQGGKNIPAKRIYPSWGLTGTATFKGWEDSIPDISLKEDAVKKGWWVLNNITLNTGELKFRFNNDWSINYGDNEKDNIPDMYGENIKVVAGIYDIIFDITNEAKPFYCIVKKNAEGLLKVKRRPSVNGGTAFL